MNKRTKELSNRNLNLTLLSDYQEMAIIALRAEIKKLKRDNELLTTLIKHT